MDTLQLDSPLAQLESILATYPHLAALLRPGDPRDSRTVSEIVRLYLEHAPDELSPASLTNRKQEMARFVAAFGERFVTDVTPLEIKRWIFSQKSWRSPHTRQRASGGIQRIFNWAFQQRLVRENHVRGVKLGESNKPRGRDMQPAEFQAILRHSNAGFRRFMVALKFTGARPGELAKLRWSHIDWNKSVAVLHEHKTARKTGRPRLLILVPQVMKLLAFIRSRQSKRCTTEFYRLLSEAPGRRLYTWDVSKRLHRRLGFTYEQIKAARLRIGAIRRRHKGAQFVYELPPGKFIDDDDGFVFLTQRCQLPWNKMSWGVEFRRVRQRAGLPKDCKVYGTRHGWITQAVKRNVNPKVIAELVGHTTTKMIDTVYTHLENDTAFLHEAARNVNGR